jgi:hypothetical protein
MDADINPGHGSTKETQAIEITNTKSPFRTLPFK